jgi:hypothetical protein
MERDRALESASPRSRPLLVAIGASNLSRGLSGLVSMARGRGAEAAEWCVAAGHGRSYGAASRVWMRRLPSVLRCGVWRGLERSLSAGDRRPVRALVTDIGNDLLYGFAVEQVASWVDECLRRLRGLGIAAVVTRLPLASIRRVGRVRYAALRTCYVPGCRLDLDELLVRAAALDRRVASSAIAHGCSLIDQPAAWYGLDAIHIRRWLLPRLWSRVADAWGLDAGSPARKPLDHLRLGLAAAEVRSLAGLVRYTAQPAVRLGSEGTVSFF